MSLYLALNKYQWEELERMIREARAEAWDEGYVAGFLKAMGDELDRFEEEKK